LIRMIWMTSLASGQNYTGSDRFYRRRQQTDSDFGKRSPGDPKIHEIRRTSYKTAFVKGEAVKIVDGPFSDFLGAVDEIDETRR